MKSFRGRFARVLTLAYSPDGSLLASGGRGGLVRIWDVAAGRVARKLRAHTNPVYEVAFRPDGLELAAAVGWAGVKTWRAADLDETGSYRDRFYGARTLSYRPDGKALVSAEMRAAAAWDLGSGAVLGHYRIFSEIQSVSYRPDGSRVAIGSGDHWVDLWDPDVSFQAPNDEIHEGDIPERIPHPTGARCVRFSPDGRALAASSGWSIHAYDVETQERVASFSGHRLGVRTLAYSPDGAWLASGSNDGSVRIWDAATGSERACYDWGIGMVGGLAFAPDGMTIAAGGEGGIVAWDAEWS